MAKNSKTTQPADEQITDTATATAVTETDTAAPQSGAETGSQPASLSAPNLTSYVVKSPIKHDGRRHEIGDTVRMTEADAETLIALGILGEG